MNLEAHTPRPSQRGYSLAELLVVIGIISIVSLVTVPNFMSMYQSSRVKASARTMTTDIRGARQLAITGNTRVRVSFLTGTNVHSYEIYSEIRNRQTGTSTWRRVKRGDLGSVVYIASSAFEDKITGDGGLKDITFLPNGTVAFDGEHPGLPAASVHLELKTEQKVPKKLYQMKFTISGNVSLT